jgi:Uma2 family endonuclease
MSSQPIPSISPAEYLRVERLSPTKHEYVDGEIFAMAGGSFNHALLATRLLASLSGALRVSGCLVINSDLRVATGAARDDIYTYPDLSIVCGEPQFLDGNRDTLLNPVVLVEVLSPSTAAYDRGKKFERYRRIPTLREYVLLEQDRVHAEIFTRQDDNSWVLRELNNIAAMLPLRSVDVEIPIAALYEGVDFGAADAADIPSE